MPASDASKWIQYRTTAHPCCMSAGGRLARVQDALPARVLRLYRLQSGGGMPPRQPLAPNSIYAGVVHAFSRVCICIGFRVQHPSPVRTEHRVATRWQPCSPSTGLLMARFQGLGHTPMVDCSRVQHPGREGAPRLSGLRVGYRLTARVWRGSGSPCGHAAPVQPEARGSLASWALARMLRH